MLVADGRAGQIGQIVSAKENDHDLPYMQDGWVAGSEKHGCTGHSPGRYSRRSWWD